jgi:hypothetical protein
MHASIVRHRAMATGSGNGSGSWQSSRLRSRMRFDVDVWRAPPVAQQRRACPEYHVCAPTTRTIAACMMRTPADLTPSARPNVR